MNGKNDTEERNDMNASEQGPVRKKRNLIPVLIGFIALLLVSGLIVGGIAVYSNPKMKYERQLSLGQKYVDELDYERAIAAYKAAIEIDPKNPDAYISLADLYVVMDNYEQAQNVLQEAIDLAGNEKLEDHLTEIQSARAKIEEDSVSELEMSESSDIWDNDQMSADVENYCTVSMDSNQQREANIFFSNLVYMGDYDHENYEIGQLIDFAYIHARANVFSELQYISDENGWHYGYSLENTNKTLERFLGVSISEEEARGIPTDDYMSGYEGYKNDCFLWIAADGDQYNRLAIVKDMTVLNENEYEFLFSIYEIDLDVWFDELGAETIPERYYQLTWEDAEKDSTLIHCYDGMAVCTPYIYDGQDTYQLLEYHLIEDNSTDYAWKEKYKSAIEDYVNEYISNSEVDNSFFWETPHFYLCHIDSNGVPAVFLRGMAGNYFTLWYIKDGQVFDYGNEGYIIYPPYSNMICIREMWWDNDIGDMTYSDTVYTFPEFEKVEGGLQDDFLKGTIMSPDYLPEYSCEIEPYTYDELMDYLGSNE